MYEITEITKHFRQGGATIRAVDGVDLEIEEGEFLVIEGPSGSGKTTLLQLLGGLDRPSAGRLFFEGKDLGGLSDKQLADLRLRAFGFVFQQFNLIPTLTARENVEVALAPLRLKGGERRQRAKTMLSKVGLADRAGHLPSQLSGGEQQRVAIARALANEPRVVLADEPTGNLDSRTSKEIVGLLSSLSQGHGQTVVMITHDQSLAQTAPRVLHITDGRFV